MSRTLSISLSVALGTLVLAACSDQVAAPTAPPAAPAAVKLAFTVQPSNATVGVAISPAVAVAIEDASGNTVTSATNVVTVAIGTNPTGGTLAGTASVAAVNGVATFSNLTIDKAATGYTLTASSGILAGSTTAAFDIAELTSLTALHVTTSTTGVSIDPDGYSLCIDPYSTNYEYDDACGTSSAIGVNSAVTVPVTPRAHVVELGGVAGNCTVSGDNPRTVTASSTGEVPFAISCVATGTVRVTIVTIGTDVDPDGYTICVDRAARDCYWKVQTRANSVVTVPGVFAGPRTVTLIGAGGNCSVSGGTSRTAEVPTDGTVDVAYAVACVFAERIAFSYRGISVAHADGSAIRLITSAGAAPAWSPDGARLAYECGFGGTIEELCAINADGTGYSRLTFDGAGNHHPTWSPDGLKIAFAATHAGVPDLHVMAANGSGVVRLTQGIGFLGSPAWSPDGTQIAFDCRVDAGNDDLCIVNADGSGFARLTTDPARDYGAAWKPDGSTLAFATTRYDADEIVLVSRAGGSVTRIGAGLPGFEPRWSPDGTQLAFVRFNGCDNYECASFEAIIASQADGSNVRWITDGGQPAWKPHPMTNARMKVAGQP